VLRRLFGQGDHERLIGPWFALERHGREIKSSGTLSKERHKEFREKLGNSAPSIRADISDQIDRLQDTLKKYKPEGVLAALLLKVINFESRAFQSDEAEKERLYAYVDYVATLYLRDRGEGLEFPVPPQEVESILKEVESIFQSLIWLWMAEDAARYNLKDAKVQRDLWFLTLVNSLTTRFPGHFEHMKEMLLGIESELASDLSEFLGWTIEEALAVGDAIVKLVDDRLNDCIEDGAKSYQRLSHDSWPHGDTGLARTVKRLFPIHRRPWLTAEFTAIAKHFASQMQATTCFSVEEVSRVSGVEEERVEALLSEASLPWGSCREEFYKFPHPTPPLLTRPAIRLDDGRYLIPVPISFSWAIRDLVETKLKELKEIGGKHCWESYERARSRFTEKKTVGLLSDAFPNAGAFHSLKYEWKEDGETIQGELDGLLLVDDTAVLVEVKSGSLSPEARRGSPDRLRDQLKALVGEAHQQALRARRFLRSADRVVFTLNDDLKLGVESGKLNDFVLITVNLDPLDVLTTKLSRLVDLGVVEDECLPWAVSFLDLVVIADAVEFPAQLLHFLRRRRRVNELGFVSAFDELDLFGHYLKEGLYFEHMEEPIRHADGGFFLNIGNFSVDLDAYYMHDERYDTDRPPKPRQKMPDEMREWLRELEDRHSPYYMHLCLALLEMGSETRTKFFEGTEEVARRASIDGKPHDMTMLFGENENGVTFMVCKDEKLLQERLLAYCQAKKYQCRAARWVGAGKVIGSGNRVDVAVVANHPWEQSDEMDQAVSLFLPSPIGQP
jgi:hypothetical protein